MGTYSDFVANAAQLCAIDPLDADFLAILPAAIQYAEERINRDVDMEASVAASAAYSLVTGNRTITLGTSDFTIVDRLNFISPGTGFRNVMLAVSPVFLDIVYGGYTPPTIGKAGIPGNGGPPKFWARTGQYTFAVGPFPDQPYVIEVTGTARPAALSAINPLTPITRDMPSLFLCSAMVFLSGWMKNYGAQGDDARQAMSWEQQYQALVSGVRGEEARKKLEAAGWTSRPPAPGASIPRA